MANGKLLKMCEEVGFDVLITCDRNLRYQQNLTGRRIGIVEVTTNYWPVIEPQWRRIVAQVDQAKPGSYAVVEISLPPKPKWNPLSQ